MGSVIFVRHGQARNNVERRLVGRSPGVPLTEKGRAQAASAAGMLSSLEISAVYSSPIERAMDTAREIAGRHSLDVVPDGRLTEIDPGSLENRTLAEVEAEHGDIFSRFYSGDPALEGLGIEPFGAICERVRDAVSEIAARHEGQNVVLASHMDPIKAALSVWGRLPPETVGPLVIANAAITVFVQPGMRLSGVNIVDGPRLALIAQNP